MSREQFRDIAIQTCGPADGGEGPRPGDLTVCFKCGAVNAFGPDGRTMVKLSETEEAALPGAVTLEVARVRLEIRAAHRAVVRK